MLLLMAIQHVFKNLLPMPRIIKIVFTHIISSYPGLNYRAHQHQWRSLGDSVTLFGQRGFFDDILRVLLPTQYLQNSLFLLEPDKENNLGTDLLQRAGIAGTLLSIVLSTTHEDACILLVCEF
jgi:hypothetical protein